MNETIETILKHRSIRKFQDRRLSDRQIRTIVECAQAASTSSFIQAYSIIGVKDPEKKQRLAAIVGKQDYVAHNGHFFVFCADLYRHTMIGERENRDVLESIESTEKFMVSIIDAALAAQNAAVAAESMGLGICYIGGLRNNLDKVQEILSTPERVIPLFGMAVGFPDQDPGTKPRLPFSHIYHEEGYKQDQHTYLQQIDEYDKQISAYYEERTGGKRRDTWSSQISGMLEKKSRMYMKEFIKKIKLNKR
ncbi:oxygen-insensitive NADPH nitroreductase [Neobacillus notoginsengisoli]|uniref:Oxygen-insensitive NADPH nitroreductase n=1 Tax=Neobacillus notoginsengisoli TaxID=1578198 RepID=A0A417YEV3_9BACI|nr:oxygen-insensitive NADPH nitroreductase [Neobacillus notoginsengisoli]RHW31181.1 oxygen-insensitive NADPH nitroreductase [Neobacillus notoginsengisoli]